VFIFGVRMGVYLFGCFRFAWLLKDNGDAENVTDGENETQLEDEYDDFFHGDDFSSGTNVTDVSEDWDLTLNAFDDDALYE
jgi:hypothetical protein